MSAEASTAQQKGPLRGAEGLPHSPCVGFCRGTMQEGWQPGPETEVRWTWTRISLCAELVTEKMDLGTVGAAAFPRCIQGWAPTGASLPLKPQTWCPPARACCWAARAQTWSDGGGREGLLSPQTQVLHPPHLSILPGKQAFPVGELQRPRCQREAQRGAGVSASIHLPASLWHLLPGGPTPCA